MNRLAIDGGKKVFPTPPAIPAWPPVYPETAETLKEIYLSRRWSFYGERELQFNEQFAAFTDSQYSVMMANGTVTLECALKVLGVGPGDEVIVPAHTWIATGEAVVYCGATPVVVDIEPDTLCLDPAKFEAAITPRTRAVIPVHLFGSLADMDKIMDIARKHGIRVIEDCAHAHGGRWNGRHVGSIGDIGSFSFQQTKLLPSGEGGCCTTNDEATAVALGRLSHIGYPHGARQGEKGTPPPVGMICHNYRVTEFQAAILLAELEHLEEDTRLRADNAAYLRNRLNAIPGIRMQAPGRLATMQSYYVFCTMVDHTRLKPGITRENVIAALQAEGVEASAGWGQVMYRQNLWTVPPERYRIAGCETAEMIVTQQLIVSSLMWLMTDRKVLDGYCDAFEKVMAEYHC